MDFGHNNIGWKMENGNTTVNNVLYSSSDAAPASATTVVEGYAGGGGQGCCHVQVDPHLTCLHLGKEQYCFNNKRGRGWKTAAFGVVPRCQVEGCHVALVNAKEYHRRHRVCDMHSKAPKVVVLGLDQRFCQQCSRFHVVSEFDDSKRSCRRRLAGHNERRRKSSHLSVTRNSRQECALSLLSSETASSDNWLSHHHHHVDLSTRCSAALHELIAENRAFLMSTKQLVNVVPHHAAIEQHFENLQQQQQPQPQSNYFPQQMFPQTH